MKCKICKNDYVRLASHVSRTHGDYREYLIKHEYNGKAPKCECGCGNDAPYTRSQGHSFKRFIHGHHANVRAPLSEEARVSIGHKNKKHMKRYWNENPEKMQQHMEMMRGKITPEIEARRIEATRKAYRNWPAEKRKAASDRAIVLLEQNKIGPQAPFKTEYKHNPFTGRKEYMHSSWESIFLDMCIELDLSVTKAHSIRIPYTDSQGIERQYVPDFVGEGVIFEVKGQETEDDRLKYAAAEVWCSENDYELVVFGKDVYLDYANNTSRTAEHH